MTDLGTWGKGMDLVTTMWNAVQGKSEIKQGQFYRFDWPDDWADEDGEKLRGWQWAVAMINVDQMGAVTYPKGVKVTELGVHNLVGVAPKFLVIRDKLAKVEK